MKHFTDSHTWIEIHGQEGRVGISTYAQKELGEIVFILLPQIGRSVRVGEEVVVLESTKAAADVYAPVSGVIIAVNDLIKQTPDYINTSPEDQGWMYTLRLTHPEEVEELMTKQEYEAVIQSG